MIDGKEKPFRRSKLISNSALSTSWPRGHTAAGLSASADRERAILGWRDLVEYADGGGFRRRSAEELVICAVHMWNSTGTEPETMADVFNRQKDIQYSSRIATHVARHQQTHRLRHVISELVAQLPDYERRNETVREFAFILRLPNPHARGATACSNAGTREPHEGIIDFSASGIRRRWEAGYTHTKNVLEQRPWEGEFDPLAGVISHEREEHLLIAAE